MSQYGNNGTINGTITTTPGKWNDAYTFNGTTAYISAQTNLIGTSATFVARAKTNVVNPQMLWNHPSNASTTYYDLWFTGNSIYLDI